MDGQLFVKIKQNRKHNEKSGGKNNRPHSPHGGPAATGNDGGRPPAQHLPPPAESLKQKLPQPGRRKALKIKTFRLGG